jgi:glycosyltransferase involved in cell wall biosynthesis
MKRVLINGNNAKTGGGKTILQGVINAAATIPDLYFVILVPSQTDILLNTNENIQFVTLPSYYQYSFSAPWVYEFVIPKKMITLEIDLVLNLGDLLINTKIPQSYIFDWAYAVYEGNSAWGQLSLTNFLIKKIKSTLISKNITNAKDVFAQTSVIKERLEKRYQVNNVSLLPVPATYGMRSLEYEKELPEGKKFLYLSYYYPHKNFEVLLNVAKLIKSSNYNFKILVTVESEQHEGAKLFLKNISVLGLDDVLINLGNVKPEQRFNLMKECSALLMPTLLETYGIPFIEAMQSKIPIFTSNLDFAKCVCQDAAFYFNPENEIDIFKCMVENIEDEAEINMKLLAGSRILKSLPTWNNYLEKAIGLIR